MWSSLESWTMDPAGSSPGCHLNRKIRPWTGLWRTEQMDYVKSCHHWDPDGAHVNLLQVVKVLRLHAPDLLHLRSFAAWRGQMKHRTVSHTLDMKVDTTCVLVKVQPQSGPRSPWRSNTFTMRLFLLIDLHCVVLLLLLVFNCWWLCFLFSGLCQKRHPDFNATAWFNKD